MTPLVLSVSRENCSIAIPTFLVEERKVDINSESAGMTPLSAAAYYGNVPVVQYLLSRGADPNQVVESSEYTTALHTVVYSDQLTPQTQRELYDMLLSHGADYTIQGSYFEDGELQTAVEAELSAVNRDDPRYTLATAIKEYEEARTQRAEGSASSSMSRTETLASERAERARRRSVRE